MRVFRGGVRGTCACAAAIGMLSFSSVVSALPVDGGTIEMVAVGASDMTKVVGGVAGLGGNNIDLSSGGVTVEFEVKLSGWNQNMACQSAKGYQIDFLASKAAQYALTSTIVGAPDVVLACAGACAVDADFVTAGNAVDTARADFMYAGAGFFPVPPTPNAGAYRLSSATSNAFGVTVEAGCPMGLQVAAQPAYGGTYFLDVPAGAKGLYQGSLDPVRTQFTDQNATSYLPTTFGAPSITVVTGRCCHNLGTANKGCTDDLLASECLDAAGSSTCASSFGFQQTCVFEGGAVCSAPPAIGDCPSCTTDADCTQSVCSGSAASCGGSGDPACPAGETCIVNNCSIGTCDTGTSTCSFVDVQTVTECCDPVAGVVTGNALDSDTCSLNQCSLDGATGNVVNLGSPFFPPAAANTPCNDNRGCTANDVCDGMNSSDAVSCAGTDINGAACTTDADCTPGFCDPAAGVCSCSEDTNLTLNILGKVCQGTTSSCQTNADCGFNGVCGSPQFPIGNCLADNSSVTVSIHAGPSASIITGGQFLVEWDPTCLVLDTTTVGPCGAGTLDQVISTEFASGSMFYAAIDSSGAGTAGNDDLACMTFTKQPGCGACDICFNSINPRNTILSSSTGNPVSIVQACSKPVRLAGVIDLVTPPGDQINVNCNEIFGTIGWNAPSASDTCDGDLLLDTTVDCVADFVPRRPELAVSQPVIDSWIMNGGDIPQGTAFFRCDTINSCGTTAAAVWTVDITDQETVDVVVQLEPAVAAGEFNRAIQFAFYDNCAVLPETVCRDMTFNTPFDFPGHANDTFKLPKGNYTCISAKDPYHTLRSSAIIESIGGKCTLAFKGDPIAGGSWLRGGNLDCRKNGFGNGNTINILDFSAFLAASAIAPGSQFVGNTTCADVANRAADQFNADINADGAITVADFGFILNNFLVDSKNVCCGNVPGASSDAGDSISVKELRMMGLSKLTIADLNGDGFVNLADMELFMQGVRPAVQVEPSFKGRTIRGR